MSFPCSFDVTLPGLILQFLGKVFTRTSSVFPTEHSLRTRTQVRHECTQVHNERRSLKLAKSTSVPFGADRPLICHSEKRRTRVRSRIFVASQTLCMHAIAIEAWASGWFLRKINV